MKKTGIIVLLLFFTVSCEKDELPVERYYCDAGYIEYKATIGYDFASALDSLLKIIRLPHEPYIVKTGQIGVDYPTADRDFYWVAFKDTADWLFLGSPMDVLDTKGCWYILDWVD